RYRYFVGSGITNAALALQLHFPFCLLAPRTWIAGRFRSHPTRLARLVAQQSAEKLPRRGRDPLLRKQRTDALLGISQRRSPQRQRIFNRRATNHQIPNHGCPWIQNSSQIATVMLGSRLIKSTIQELRPSRQKL